MADAGFEPAPFQTSALNWRLRPLGQSTIETPTHHKYTLHLDTRHHQTNTTNNPTTRHDTTPTNTKRARTQTHHSRSKQRAPRLNITSQTHTTSRNPASDLLLRGISNLQLRTRSTNHRAPAWLASFLTRSAWGETHHRRVCRTTSRPTRHRA